MTDRYALREEPTGMWTVYDVFTGQPAMVGDSAMVEMDIEEADDMAELLNLQDATRRGKAGKLGPAGSV